MAQHSTTCPVCNNELTAETEDALVKQFQQHAHEEHGKQMSEQEARDMVKKQAGG